MFFLKCSSLLFLLAAICALVQSQAIVNNPDSLQLVFTIFRNGERTPTQPPYPKDPYTDVQWFPYGFGQITNAGKTRSYQLGLALRQLYNTFLGDLYYDGIIKARSTAIDRTKTSLQLVLAGLFPPKDKTNIWSQNYPIGSIFQPIPTEYNPLDNDPELMGNQCQIQNEIFNTTKTSPDFQAKRNNQTGIFNYLGITAGLNTSDEFKDTRKLYYDLQSQKQYGLPLPQWANMLYPSVLAPTVIDSYLVENLTPELKKYASGFLLKSIFDEAAKKINGTLPSGRKMYLFSGSDVNIVNLLIGLGVYTPHIPNFGSSVTVEVHQSFIGQYVKVFYDNNDGFGRRELSIPGCGRNCPLDTVKGIVSPFLPLETDVCKPSNCPAVQGI